MTEQRVIYRTTRPNVALKALRAELRAEYDTALLGIRWHKAPNVAQGDLEIYFSPETDIQLASQIVQNHDATTALQAIAQAQQRRQVARQKLRQIAIDFDDDWSISPPPDALEKVRRAILTLVHLERDFG